VFSRLGAILQTGGLEDLAAITTASAAILEGQEEHVGRALDGTAKLIASLRSQKDALAAGLDDLASAAGTLSAGRGTLDRALDVSDDALRVVASQQTELEDLVIALDKLGAPLARLTKAYKSDVNEQVEILNEVVPKVYEVRDTLADAVEKLPPFTSGFARAAPGDYVQLDVYVEALPIGTPTSAPMTAASIKRLFLEVTR
jgi:phospholipid/cholesterol/gamma-HCH transport system substrate-binding protein